MAGIRYKRRSNCTAHGEPQVPKLRISMKVDQRSQGLASPDLDGLVECPRQSLLLFSSLTLTVLYRSFCCAANVKRLFRLYIPTGRQSANTRSLQMADY